MVSGNVLMTKENYSTDSTLYIHCTTEKERGSCLQWSSAVFGQNLRDSGKYFTCFLVIGFVYVPLFTFDCFYTCMRVVLWQNYHNRCL